MRTEARSSRSSSRQNSNAPISRRAVAAKFLLDAYTVLHSSFVNEVREKTGSLRTCLWSLWSLRERFSTCAEGLSLADVLYQFHPFVLTLSEDRPGVALIDAVFRRATLTD